MIFPSWTGASRQFNIVCHISVKCFKFQRILRSKCESMLFTPTAFFIFTSGTGPFWEPVNVQDRFNIKFLTETSLDVCLTVISIQAPDLDSSHMSSDGLNTNIFHFKVVSNMQLSKNSGVLQRGRISGKFKK